MRHGLWKSITVHKARILVCGCVLLAIVIGVLPEIHARIWEKRWNDFFNYWKDQGEIFDPVILLPPDIGEDAEFAKHPWIRRIADGDAAVLDALSRMGPGNLEGYEEWHANTNADAVHHPMPTDLAERVIRHAHAFRAELDAFVEAVRRPGARISDDNHLWISKLTPVKDLLCATAHADASLRNVYDMTRRLDTMLRTGWHLRSSNITLGMVVGSGFEAAAYEVILSLERLGYWPEDARREWLAAMNLRTRTQSDEFVACIRHDRGKYLAALNEIAKNPSHLFMPKLTILPPLRRAFVARARLATCEALQEMVLSEDDRIVSVIDPARVSRFQSHVETARDRLKSASQMTSIAEQFGMLPHFMMLGMHDALVHHENERNALRLRIAKSLDVSEARGESSDSAEMPGKGSHE